jgi:hypothetical protein
MKVDTKEGEVSEFVIGMPIASSKNFYLKYY